MTDANMPSLPDWGEPQEDSPTEREENGRGTGGAGSDGTIPDDEDGLAVGVSDEPTTFEPEEDPEAASGVDGDVDDGATELRA